MFAADAGFRSYSDLASEFVKEALHFSRGVLIAGALGSLQSAAKASDRLIAAAKFGKGLGRHLIGRHVIGVVSDQRFELRKRCGGISFGDLGHSKAVSGEGVRGVLLEYLGEKGNSVHGTMVRRWA